MKAQVHKNVMHTGTVFKATDRQGNTYEYEFIGIALEDATGCNYIVLWNITNNSITTVEHTWFRERKIKRVDIS